MLYVFDFADDAVDDAKVGFDEEDPSLLALRNASGKSGRRAEMELVMFRASSSLFAEDDVLSSVPVVIEEISLTVLLLLSRLIFDVDKQEDEADDDKPKKTFSALFAILSNS